METDKRTEPLREWNRLARENTENAIVSSMFNATLRTTFSISEFSNWVLVATAAVASFLLVNANDLMDFVGKEGIIAGGYILSLSCIFGLFSRVIGLRCKMAIELHDAIRHTFIEHLERYEAEEEKIQEGASFWGINLEAGIRFDRILKEFLAPFPWFVKYFATKHIEKNSENPQIAYLTQLKNLRTQAYATIIQAGLFIYFFVQVFSSASKL
ncbi:hypothetical protein [Simiduia aestuariiviva]|uniref:SMODS and SLOG-associating 2TM effector domain-containing protein n=1 Tax=Simiduia aestuariiviva TaxID=1510459 RepID=A0A839UK71_9GAMM|nr:hypothetical protein [Simiduia aestuariiviva]MBB3167171.1 hypothetical protein [Simiduia aestuariiviva]